jgi:hypothetical protein
MPRHGRRSPPGRSGIAWICPRCLKKAYSTWTYATHDADRLREGRQGSTRYEVYWSRQCHAFHIGTRHVRKRRDP